MADRLYTSSEADEVLSALRFETKLEKATLARIAFAFRLSRKGRECRPSPNFSGGEMKRPTFVGEDEVFLRHSDFLHLSESETSARMSFFPIARL